MQHPEKNVLNDHSNDHFTVFQLTFLLRHGNAVVNILKIYVNVMCVVAMSAGAAARTHFHFYLEFVCVFSLITNSSLTNFISLKMSLFFDLN